jgi:tight adherence protein B
VENNLDSVVMWFVSSSVFGLTASIWFGAMMLWYVRKSAARKKLEQRLNPIDILKVGSPRVLRLWHDGQMTTTVVQGRIKKPSLVARLEEMRRALGWNVPVHTIVLGFMGGLLLAYVVALAATGSPMLALAGAGTAGVLMRWYGNRQLAKKESLFETQLADALGLATRSLRVGHPLLGAFRLIVDEMDAPVKDVFGEICQQQTLGTSLEDAIRNTAAKSTSPDFRLFAASIVIQLRSGGNLADMMERLAEVIRDRIRLKRRARILTSQTQLSKRILIGLPFVLFFALYVMNPDYLGPLYTTRVGQILLLIAASCLALGAWAMNRIAQLKY